MKSLMSVVIVGKLGSALLQQMSIFLLTQSCVLALAAPGHQKGWHSSHQCQWPVPIPHCSTTTGLRAGCSWESHIQSNCLSTFSLRISQQEGANPFSSYTWVGWSARASAARSLEFKPWVNSSLCLSDECGHMPPTLVLATCQLWSRVHWLAPWTQPSWINSSKGITHKQICARAELWCRAL